MQKVNRVVALYLLVSLYWCVQNAGGQLPALPVPVPPLPEQAKPVQPTVDQLSGKKPTTPPPAASPGAEVSATAPAANATDPATNATAPAANATDPATNATSLVANATSPATNATTPGTNATSPAGNSATPAGNTAFPAGNTSIPAEASNATVPVPVPAEKATADKTEIKNDASIGKTSSSSSTANAAASDVEYPKQLDFLGIEPPEITEMKLKKIKEGTQNQNPENSCGRTYYMGPFSRPTVFMANGSVQLRSTTSCDWAFIGTEPCIPLLTCQYFNLDNANEKCEEYMEVYDGRRGKLKLCGINGPIGVSGNGELRDLYVKYVTTKRNGMDGDADSQRLKFNCTVTCSQRGDGYELPNTFEPIIDTQCFCGMKPNQDRIVNGQEVTRKEFPWMVALVRKNTRQPICGGTLINDRMVITAAHCLQGPFLNVDNIEVVLGAHIMDKYSNPKFKRHTPKVYDSNTLAQLDAQNGSSRQGIDEIIVHPLFVEQTRDFDVALLVLSAPIDFGLLKTLSPICLPKTGSYLRTFSNRSAVVAGWGFESHDAYFSNPRLQKSCVDVYPPKPCKALYPHNVNRRMLCAGAKNKNENVCLGDAGGPLMSDDKPQIWHLIGILTGGDECSETGKPAIYFRSTEIGQWSHYHSNRNEAVWCSIPKSAKSTS